MKAVTYRAIALLVLGVVVFAGPRPAAAETGGQHKAPTRLHAEPPSFFLLPLGGDRAHFRYTPGSLDRAANLQQRMEVLARGFERWLDQPIEYAVFVMSRREWQEAGITVDYGIPVRVGMRGLAVPAQGDDGTVELWSSLLGGMLPTVVGTPIRGTPREVASMVMADVVTQLLAGEILVDTVGPACDEPWVRGVMAQLAALTVVKRLGTDRLESLEVLYRQLASRHPPKAFSARDYHPDLALADWLWFQAQFHFGARAIYDKKGKNALKELRKLGRKGDGVLQGDLLRRKIKGLDEWFQTTFSVVSFQR